MSRSRSYVFTLNNYTDADIVAVKSLKYNYLVYGFEVGESGTPHLQGYVYLSNPCALSALSKRMRRAHLEVAKGSFRQASDYCKKGGLFYEDGTLPMDQKEKGQCNVTRWNQARQLANQGRFDEIEDELYIKYQKSFKSMYEDNQEKPQSIPDLDFWWFKGPSGSGKSLTARVENPDHYLKATNKWWDGYKCEPCVIIDEWSPSHGVLADHLKRWADHHPFVAEIKGGTRVLRPKKIIITSNYDMGDCFERPEDLKPLGRRFKIRIFPEN